MPCVKTLVCQLERCSFVWTFWRERMRFCTGVFSNITAPCMYEVRPLLRETFKCTPLVLVCVEYNWISRFALTFLNSAFYSERMQIFGGRFLLLPCVYLD